MQAPAGRSLQTTRFVVNFAKNAISNTLLPVVGEIREALQAEDEEEEEGTRESSKEESSSLYERVRELEELLGKKDLELKDLRTVKQSLDEEHAQRVDAIRMAFNEQLEAKKADSEKKIAELQRALESFQSNSKELQALRDKLVQVDSQKKKVR